MRIRNDLTALHDGKILRQTAELLRFHAGIEQNDAVHQLVFQAIEIQAEKAVLLADEQHIAVSHRFLLHRNKYLGIKRVGKRGQNGQKGVGRGSAQRLSQQVRLIVIFRNDLLDAFSFRVRNAFFLVYHPGYRGCGNICRFCNVRDPHVFPLTRFLSAVNP